MSETQPLVEPAPGQRCRACDGHVAADTLRCQRCGAAYGEQNRCPHCGIVAGTEPALGLGRCRACGLPRVTLSANLPRSGAEAPLLARAHRQRRLARFSTLAARLVAAATLSLFLVIALALASHFSLGLLLLSLLVFVPGAASVWLELRARHARGEHERALDAALASLTADIVRHTALTDAESLARLLGVDVARATRLLAEVEVSALLNSGPTTARLGAVPTRTDAADTEAIALGDSELPARTVHHQQR